MNGELISDDFNVWDVIPNERLPESLAELAVGIARERYEDVRIIPGDVALKGYEWQLKDPSHIIYVKYNQSHPDYDPSSIRFIMLNLVHGQDKKKMRSIPPYKIR